MTVSTQGSSFRGGRPPKAHLKITASTTTIAMLTPQAPGSCPPARATVAVASAVAKAVSPTSSVNWLVSSANWWSISRTSSSWITSIEADHAGGELLAEGRGNQEQADLGRNHNHDRENDEDNESDDKR